MATSTPPDKAPAGQISQGSRLPWHVPEFHVLDVSATEIGRLVPCSIGGISAGPHVLLDRYADASPLDAAVVSGGGIGLAVS